MLEGIINKYKSKIPLFITLLIIMIWALMYFDKYAFVSEGWFFSYADMILDGRIPYRDFEMVFPPLYPFIITAVQYVFGHNLIIFRIIGVILIILMTYYLFKIFSLVTNNILSSIAALFAFFVLQSQESFLSYDYVNFYQLFYYIAFYYLAKIIKLSLLKDELDNDQLCKKKMSRYLILMGLFTSCSLLCRQSSGIIIFLFILITLILSNTLKITNQSLMQVLIKYITSFLIPVSLFLVYFIMTNSLDDFIHCVFFSKTKGDLNSMLFSWIKPIFSEHRLSVILGVIFSIIIVCVFLITNKNKNSNNTYNNALAAGSVIVTAVFVIVTYFSLNISQKFINYYRNPIFFFFAINCILLITSFIYTVYSVKKHNTVDNSIVMCLLFTGFSFALEFGAGTSATITRNEGAIMVSFIFISLIVIASKIKIEAFKLTLSNLTFVLVLFIIISSMAIKVVVPYEFGGEYVAPHTESVYNTDIPYFQYMKLNESEKYCYEDFISLSEILSEDDQIYCFCQFTLFYELAHKIPISGLKSSAPWIDIASDESVLHDLNLLQSSRPKMILYTDYGDHFWTAMEKVFRNGAHSGQRVMNEWLNECRDGNNGYHLEKVYVVDSVQINVLINN